MKAAEVRSLQSPTLQPQTPLQLPPILRAPPTTHRSPPTVKSPKGTSTTSTTSEEKLVNQEKPAEPVHQDQSAPTPEAVSQDKPVKQEESPQADGGEKPKEENVVSEGEKSEERLDKEGEGEKEVGERKDVAAMETENQLMEGQAENKVERGREVQIAKTIHSSVFTENFESTKLESMCIMMVGHFLLVLSNSFDCLHLSARIQSSIYIIHVSLTDAASTDTPVLPDVTGGQAAIAGQAPTGEQDATSVQDATDGESPTGGEAIAGGQDNTGGQQKETGVTTSGGQEGQVSEKPMGDENTADNEPPQETSAVAPVSLEQDIQQPGDEKGEEQVGVAKEDQVMDTESADHSSACSKG